MYTMSVFKIHEIWSVDSSENCKNCCHQLSDFKAKMHHIRFRLGLCPRPCWGSLQRSPRPASWIKGGLFLREGRERVGKRGRGGGRGEGREGGRGSFSVPPTFPPKSMPLPSVPPPCTALPKPHPDLHETQSLSLQHSILPHYT